MGALLMSKVQSTSFVTNGFLVFWWVDIFAKKRLYKVQIQDN